jgi:type IV secretory pathway VirB10-like protein
VPSSRARLLLEQPRARELRPWLHDSRRPDEPPTSRLPRAPPVAPPASALEARARRASQQASERATDRLQRRAAAGATSGVTKARERGSGSACTTDRSSLASSSSASGGASSRSGEASGRRAPVASACAASYDDRAVDGFYTTRSTTDGRDGSRAPSTARSRCAEQY